MKTSKTIGGHGDAKPVLAASVGLGETVLDTIIIDGSQSLRVGGGAGCHLPFTCGDTVLATRRDGVWMVRPPDGVDVDGGEARDDGAIALYDWSGGMTLADGAAWLRLWPTRGERYTGPGMAGGAARSLGRALPVLWLAFAVTVGLGTFGWWARAALAGNPYASGTGAGVGTGLGDAPDRVASFGDGEFAAGTWSSAWVSVPEPEEEVVEEEEVVDATADEEEVVEEEVVDATADEEEVDATAADEEEVDATATEEPVAEPELDPELAADAVAAAEEGDARSRKVSRRGGSHARGGASGGGGSFGLGGGTDDGFADRTESLQALERKLLGCISGDDAYRVTLSVNRDGSPDLRSLDYDRGSWSAAERSCVGAAIEEWAFPRGSEDYEVSLRLRKARRGGRA